MDATVKSHFTGHEDTAGTKASVFWRPTAKTGLVSWLPQPGVPRTVPMPAVAGAPPLVAGTQAATAPSVGADSEAILREHGYSDAAIADLIARGVVGSRPVGAAAAS